MTSRSQPHHATSQPVAKILALSEFRKLRMSEQLQRWRELSEYDQNHHLDDVYDDVKKMDGGCVAHLRPYDRWKKRMEDLRCGTDATTWQCPYGDEEDQHGDLQALCKHVEESTAKQHGNRHDELKCLDGWYGRNFWIPSWNGAGHEHGNVKQDLPETKATEVKSEVGSEVITEPLPEDLERPVKRQRVKKAEE